jgi:hypothetical protein
MATSVPVEGETTIQSPEEVPMLQLYLQNPQILQTIRVHLPSLNKSQL